MIQRLEHGSDGDSGGRGILYLNMFLINYKFILIGLNS